MRDMDIMDYSILLGFHFKNPDSCPNALLEQHQLELRAKKSSRTPSRKETAVSPSIGSSTGHLVDIMEADYNEKGKEKGLSDEESPELHSQLPRGEDIEVGGGDSVRIFNDDGNFLSLSLAFITPLSLILSPSYHDTPTDSIHPKIDDTELSQFSEAGKRDQGIPSYDNTSELYYMTIIDTLQLYDLNKKSERFWKVYVAHKNRVLFSPHPHPTPTLTTPSPSHTLHSPH